MERRLGFRVTGTHGAFVLYVSLPRTSPLPSHCLPLSPLSCPSRRVLSYPIYPLMPPPLLSSPLPRTHALGSCDVPPTSAITSIPIPFHSISCRHLISPPEFPSPSHLRPPLLFLVRRLKTSFGAEANVFTHTLMLLRVPPVLQKGLRLSWAVCARYNASLAFPAGGGVHVHRGRQRGALAHNHRQPLSLHAHRRRQVTFDTLPCKR